MNITTHQIYNILKIYNKQSKSEEMDKEKQGVVHRTLDNPEDKVAISDEGKKRIMKQTVTLIVDKLTSGENPLT